MAVDWFYLKMSFRQRSSRNSDGRGFQIGMGGYVSPWLPNAGPASGHPQQFPKPAQLGMAGNDIGGGPQWSSIWGYSDPKMSDVRMQRQDNHKAYNKDNMCRSGNNHKILSSSYKSRVKYNKKRYSSGKINDGVKKRQKKCVITKEQMLADQNASYAGVPSAFFYCRICSMHMQDPESFVKHICGKSHEENITYIDKKYQKKVASLRCKIIDNEKEKKNYLQHNKQKSNSGELNSTKNIIEKFCCMCDAYVIGPLLEHKQSDGHKELKNFLYPECKFCNVSFRSRIDLDKHELTAGHLMKVAVMGYINIFPHFKDDEIDKMTIKEKKNDRFGRMAIETENEMLVDSDSNQFKLVSVDANGENEEKKDVLATVTNVSDITTDKIVEESDNDGKNEKKIEISCIENEDHLILCNQENQIVHKIKRTAAYDLNAIGIDALLLPNKKLYRLCSHYELPYQLRWFNYYQSTAITRNKKREIDEVGENVIVSDNCSSKNEDNNGAIVFESDPQPAMTDTEVPDTKH